MFEWRPQLVLLLFPVLLSHTAVGYDNSAPNSKLPPLGWSSWVALGPKMDTDSGEAPIFDFCDEPSVRLSIDAYHEVGLYEFGYRHFHLDDCWADRKRNGSGFLQADLDRFPNGIKPLVDYAHSRNLTFGLYTCAGSKTCYGGRMGSKDHWEQDATAFADWGVDVVKMDWCNTAGMHPQVAYKQMSDALNKTGRPIHLNMCEWGLEKPWKWGPAVAQSWRATPDHAAKWASTKDIVARRTQISAEEGGAPYAWNDLDMLQTGNYLQSAHDPNVPITDRMTALEYKTEFSMWAILASPLMVTTPILNCSSTDQVTGKFTPSKCRPSLTPLQKEILFNSEVLAINQDETPAGHLLNVDESLTSEGTATLVYARNLSDGSVAVAFYNPTDQAAAGAVLHRSLGWDAGTLSTARDLWLHKDLGSHSGRFPANGSVSVEPHATALFRLTPHTPYVAVILQ